MSGPIRTTLLLGVSIALLPVAGGCHWLKKDTDKPYTSDLTPQSAQTEEDEMVDYVGSIRESEQGTSSPRRSDWLFFSDPRSQSINDNFVR